MLVYEPSQLFPKDFKQQYRDECIATGPIDWVTSPQGLSEAFLGDGGGVLVRASLASPGFSSILLLLQKFSRKPARREEPQNLGQRERIGERDPGAGLHLGLPNFTTAWKD